MEFGPTAVVAEDYNSAAAELLAQEAELSAIDLPPVELAIHATRALDMHPDQASGVADEFFPEEPEKAEQLHAAVREKLGYMIDREMVLAGEANRQAAFERRDEESLALPVIVPAEADATGAQLNVHDPLLDYEEPDPAKEKELIEFEKEELKQVQESPVSLSVMESRVVLAALAGSRLAAEKADDKAQLEESNQAEDWIKSQVDSNQVVPTILTEAAQEESAAEFNRELAELVRSAHDEQARVEAERARSLKFVFARTAASIVLTSSLMLRR